MWNDYANFSFCFVFPDIHVIQMEMRRWLPSHTLETDKQIIKTET